MAPRKPDAAYDQLMSMMAGISKPGNVQFLKDGDTQVKLLLPSGAPDASGMAQMFNTWFPSKTNPATLEPFPYFLICGVIVSADEQGVADPSRVRYIKVPQTVLREIIAIYGKWGKKLFEDNGPTITIMKAKGKNAKPPYRASLDPDEFNILDVDGKGGTVTWPEQTIQDAAQDQEARSLEMAQDGQKNPKTPVAEDLL